MSIQINTNGKKVVSILGKFFIRLAESVLLTYLIHIFIIDISKESAVLVILISFSLSFLSDFVIIMASNESKSTTIKSEKMTEQNERSYLYEVDESFGLFVLKCFFTSIYSALLLPIAFVTTASTAFQIFISKVNELSFIPEIVIATIIGIVLHLFVKKKTKMIENK